MSVTQQGVLEILNRLIQSDELKPTVDQYLDGLRGDPRAFYQSELASHGLEVAEASLADIAQRRHLREFAGAIEPIVVGMRDVVVTSADIRCSVVDASSKSPLFPVQLDLKTRAVVVCNLPQHERCGCSQPDGADVFGQKGTLPLLALVLVESHRFGRDHKLYLVFPARNNPVGYVLVQIRRNGDIDGEEFVSHMTSDSLLQCELGTTSVSGGLRVFRAWGGSLDYRLGFPGAEQYLLQQIPLLGPYLSALAKHQKHH